MYSNLNAPPTLSANVPPNLPPNLAPMPTFTSPAFEYGAPYPVYSYSCPNNRNDFILIIVLFILLIIVGGSFFCDSKC
ncbi:YjcZ family sporulation protein [Cytobacillus praedii]|nr:YjcZ family sporulation protein [Cytobacillus praedii]